MTVTSNYQVGGSIAADSTRYIQREADIALLSALKNRELCYVFNSRQMGKSSLLLKIKSQLQQENYRCCFVDMSRIGSVHITLEQWYGGIVAEIWRGFSYAPGNAVFQWWSTLGDISAAQKLAALLDKIIDDSEVGQEFVIFFDEVDSVLSLPFSADDFFSVIRACYNQRANQAKMKRLQFALFGVALPSDLMSDPQRSPFNIGRAIALQGFKFEKSLALATGLNVDHLDNKKLLAQVLAWSFGQPFLTQKICQLIADNKDNRLRLNEQDWLAELLAEKIIDDWVRKDNPEHLRTIRDRLLLDDNQATFNLDIYQQLLSSADESLMVDENIDYSRLLLTGLINIEQGKITVRAKVYRQVFNIRWLEQAIANRRPYGEKLTLWQLGEDSRWLLAGDELNSANHWAKGKHLPELDHSFIAASQSQENQQVQAWNQKLQAEIQQRQQVEDKLKQTLVLLEQAKAKAEQANLAKTDFLARVSHEVRTPINNILGLSYLALQPDNAKQQQDYLSKIHHASTYMLAVVNDIVDIGKLERNELVLNQQAFLLTDVFDNINDLLGTRLRDKNLHLRSNIAQTHFPMLMGDAMRLQQLLVNLITNAIKHTEQGTITIAVNASNSDKEQLSLTFVVNDTGNGISNKAVAGQVSQHADSVIPVGLGLSLCCQLAELMADEADSSAGLKVNSSPTTGCQFSFTCRFTLAADAKQCIEKMPNSEPLSAQVIDTVVGAQCANKRILVVEDDDINQQIMQELLRPLALLVEIAVNGQQALKVLTEQRFDLVLMDIEMPIMDGITAIKQIRKFASKAPEVYENLVNLPVIAMTAHALIDDQRRFIDLGFNEYLAKPIDPIVLTQRVSHWLARAEQSHQHKLPVVKERIILVDKLADNLRLMSANLKSHYSILATTSIEKALVIAQKSPLPTAILLSESFSKQQDPQSLVLCRQIIQLSISLNIPLVAIVEQACTPSLDTGVDKSVSPEQLQLLLAIA
ncbi:AAA-like domain-containing protein [Colwellia piezophila]|uniref:AAA-like domain-containing protein n=1 Tax=Colwellia piezophila TaxID=211668 RepID=UPI00039F1ED2|nr:AAA-like domain-containing protein [Colwellia piezophila]